MSQIVDYYKWPEIITGKPCLGGPVYLKVGNPVVHV